jgi:prepilin-type N-terminal cleavage/methylation domain-containing protein
MNREEDGGGRCAASSGFTLVELLMVIVIIGMLFGLLTVALQKASENAKKGKARTDVSTLASAIYTYRHEYDMWPGGPCPGVHTNDGGNGHDEYIYSLSEDDQTRNRRGIEFINWDEYRIEDDTILNPWGDPYVIVINCNRDTVTVRDPKTDAAKSL